MKIKINKIGFYIKTFSTDEVKDTVHVYEFCLFLFQLGRFIITIFSRQKHVSV